MAPLGSSALRLSSPRPLPPPPHPSQDPWQDGFQLGDWWVDVSGNRLVRDAEVRPLRHKAMALLVMLARHEGRTVAREDIVNEVWDGNQFVAPKAINTAVWTIRQALGDDPDTPRYLETIAKKGYRLVAPVSHPIAREPTHDAPAGGPRSPSTDLGVDAAHVSDSPDSPRRSRWIATGLGGALLLAAAAWWAGSRPSAAPEGPRSASPLSAPEALSQEEGVEYLAAQSPDGRHLAFAWWRGQGVGELHLRDLASGGRPASPPRPVSHGAGDVHGLAWAPDGHALAFAAMQADGSCALWRQDLGTDGRATKERQRLGRCAPLYTATLAWSPDGRWLAYSGEQDGAGGLFLMSPQGGTPRRLTTAAPGAMADHQPSWSPDGRHIAFVRQDPADGTRDVYETTLDGEPRRLTQLRLHHVHGLAHAPDGQDLVLSTTVQDLRVLQRWQRHDGRVVPLGLEGSAPSRASDGSLVYALMRSHVSLAQGRFDALPRRAMQSIASDRWPRPDPRGERVAFVSRRSGSLALWVAHADGSQARALADLGGQSEAPAWSPDGRQLAFVGACGPGRRVGLCRIGADGQGLAPVAADAAGYGSPQWHPTRPELWTVSDRGGRWQLWRFPAEGGAGQPEPTEHEPGRALQWAADGSGFVYQTRGSDRLRWRSATGPQAGQERELVPAHHGESLLDWQWSPRGVVALVRSDRERWRLLPWDGSASQALGDHPVGTFPERARFAIATDGTLWVELADTNVADIFRVR